MRRVLLCTVLSSAALLSAEFGPDAVWKPGEQFVPDIHKSCAPAKDLGTCFASAMGKEAPAPAVAFTKSIRNEGWMSGFRYAGRVDIAYVTYPFRANENHGWMLINGSPDRVDVDDLRKLPQKLMKDDPSWSRLLATKPNASIFPGDRFSPQDPVAIHRSNGSQQFIVNYRVVDGCHSCEVLGYVFFGFNFDHKGKFTGADFLGFETAVNPHQVPSRPVLVHSGDKFQLALPWDSQREFDWSIVQPGSDNVIRLVGSQNDSEKSIQLWSFTITGTGATQVVLKYASPKSADATTLPLLIKAAPGLGR